MIFNGFSSAARQLPSAIAKGQKYTQRTGMSTLIVKTAGTLTSMPLEKRTGTTALSVKPGALRDNDFRQVNPFKGFTSLKEIHAAQNQLGIAAIARMSELPNVHAVDMSKNDVNDHVLLVLAKMMPGLTMLGLSGSDIGLLSLQLLPDLEKLTSLQLADCKVCDVGMDWVTKSEKIQILDISANGLDDRTLEKLSRMPDLTQLDFSMNDAGVKGISLLTETKMPTLQVLHMAYSHVGDEGMSILATAERKPSEAPMEMLDLKGNGITDKGIIDFARQYIGSVKTIDLRHNPVSDKAAVESLRENEGVGEVLVDGPPVQRSAAYDI